MIIDYSLINIMILSEKFEIKLSKKNRKTGVDIVIWYLLI